MANEKLNLDGLTKPGAHAQTATKPDAESKPAPIDISHLYGEFGGKLIAPPETGSTKPVDISHLYGEHGGKVLDAPTQAKGAERVDLSSLYGERGGLLQTQTTADEPSDEE